MILHVSDLVLILFVVAAGFAGSYLLLLRKFSQMLSERQLKIAEQLGRLDDAIQTLETRLAESHPGTSVSDWPFASSTASEQEAVPEGLTSEIKAAIAAAAVATLGPKAQIRSIQPASSAATSPWTQQGRVLVQGSHNLRVRR